MAQRGLPARSRSVVAAAVIVVFCGAVSTTVAADGDASVTADFEPGIVDGAIVAVDTPPVPSVTEVVAVDSPPVPIRVAVGRPPVPAHEPAPVPARGRDYGAYELNESISDAFATLRAGLVFLDGLF